MTADLGAVLARVPRGLLIGGTWETGLASEHLDVRDPATDEVIATVPAAGPSDGVRALDAAVAAHEGWAATAPGRRGELLRVARQRLTDESDAFALLITSEMGKPLPGAAAEVARAADSLGWSAQEALRAPGRRAPGRRARDPGATGRRPVTPHPVGPCLVITPWNSPLAVLTRTIAPALAAGCTLVVKPAGSTPLTALLLARVLEEVGFPPGVVNVVPTQQSPALCARLIADRRLGMLRFAGSAEVGGQLLAQAPRTLPTSMQLGGNAPFLVFGDADLPTAVLGAVQAAFGTDGVGTATNQVLVHESVAREFVESTIVRVESLRMGHGAEAGVDIGPLAAPTVVAEVTALVADAVRRGARIRTGGHAVTGPGNFFPPTVLIDVAVGSRVLRSSTSWAVLVVTTFRDEGEAVQLANDGGTSPAAFVYTRDQARGQRLAGRLQAGVVGWNTRTVSIAEVLSGGGSGRSARPGEQA